MIEKIKEAWRKRKYHLDEFDSTLIHLDRDVPKRLRDYILDNYINPMLRESWHTVGSEFDIRDGVSLIRFEANGKMHTRVIVYNNGGGAEDAIDIDGRMGELLWALCRNREDDE